MNASILYRNKPEYIDYGNDDLVADLRIGEILGQITLGSEDAASPAYYLRKPKKQDDVLFRLAVMRDLEHPRVREAIEEFMNRFGQYRTYLDYSDSLPQLKTRQKWRFDAARTYCACLAGLRDGLSAAAPRSEGLRRFLTSLADSMNTPEFEALHRDTAQCAARLDGMRYTLELWLYQNRLTVRPETAQGEDACERLARVFSRYDIAPCPRMVPFPGVNMESLELAVLERLEGMFPEEFGLLGEFCERHPSVGSPLADGFASELRFYLDYLTYMERMRTRGYLFAYPEFNDVNSVRICAGYDLSLAREADARVTPNDFTRDAGESFIVTGPNQGGKTAYVRMVGQAAYFACLGLPAPCKRLELYFIEEIRTHFAREEDLSNNYGRLKEELERAKRMLDALPSGSLVLLNDLFASTTTFDALEIGGKLLGRLMKHGCLCLFATNFHELAATPGMARLHAAPDEVSQAYRVTREPPGKPAANRLIPAYRLTYDDIRSRL